MIQLNSYILTMIITASIRRMREGNREGVTRARSGWGDTPSQVQTGGYPMPGPHWGGYPISGPDMASGVPLAFTQEDFLVRYMYSSRKICKNLFPITK